MRAASACKAMTADKLAAKIISDLKQPTTEGLMLAKLQAANELLNLAKPPEIFIGFKFFKCPPVARKVPWRMFPKFYI